METQQTVIGKEASIEGVLTIKNSVLIDGNIKGELSSTETVTIGADGLMNGNVHGKNIVIGGKVEGSVTATERVKLESNAKLDGDIITMKLVIEEGARFEGSCSMSGQKSPASTKPGTVPPVAGTPDKKPQKPDSAGENSLRL